MFRKIMVYTLSLFAALLFFAAPTLADDRILVKADWENEQMRISGETAADIIALEIKDPRGNIVLVDEIKVLNNKFSTTYHLTSAATGSYLVTVYGQGKYVTTNFVVRKESNNHSGSNGGGGSSNATKKVKGNHWLSTTVVNEQGEVVETVTITADGLAQLIKTNNENKGLIDIAINDTGEKPGVTLINIPQAVLNIVQDYGIKITTAQAAVELPKELLKTLDAADLSVQIKHQDVTAVNEALTSTSAAVNGVILGKPIEINAPLRGNIIVGIPLDAVDIPHSTDERKSFLHRLEVFAIYNDGKNELIDGQVLYADNMPTALEVTVTKLGTFAIVKLPVKEVSLYINKSEAFIDGKKYLSNVKPYLNAKYNRVMVPVRFVCEALGAKVNYIQDDMRVIINDGKNELIFTIGNDKAVVNQKEVYLDCPPAVISGHAFLPVRFVCESLGAKVMYKSESQQVVISK